MNDKDLLTLAQKRAKKLKIWNDQVEELARHLCEEKGIDPDHWWNYYKTAEKYLRRRIMNKYYWEHLSGHYDL